MYWLGFRKKLLAFCRFSVQPFVYLVVDQRAIDRHGGVRHEVHAVDRW
jgi:hypothetical protein